MRSKRFTPITVFTRGVRYVIVSALKLCRNPEEEEEEDDEENDEEEEEEDLERLRLVV